MNSQTLAVLGAANSVHTQRWVNALSKSFDVSLFSLETHKDNLDSFCNEVKVHYLPASGKWAYFTAHKALNKLIGSKEFDIYNAHYASGYGTILRLSKKKPAVLNFWGSDIYEFPKTSVLHKYILRKNILFADTIVSTSNIMAEKIKEVYPFVDKVKVIPFGVDMEQFPYRERSILKPPIRFGTCKLLNPIYAIDDMIKAFSIANEVLDAEGINSTLDIYGDGESRQELEELVRKLNLSSKVTFHGWITHSSVPAALNQMDIFLLTSISESFGVSAVEAMAVGIPVIATRTPGFQEVIVNKQTGVLVDIQNYHAMAKEMISLAKNNSNYIYYALNGLNRVKEKYDWNKNVADFKALLESLASGSQH